MILKDIIKKFDKSNIKAGDGLEFGNYPLYTCSPIINKYLNDYHYDEEAIIVSTGGNFSVHYVNGKFNYSTDCYVFNTDKYNLKYLYYYLISKSDDINKMFRGAGLKHLNKNEFVMLNIKDIPMEEQKSIVNQLDKIKKMIDLRKNEIEKYNELIKSQFVEMFQSGNYPKNELGKLCDVRDGTHDSPKYLEESEYKFITSKNIVNNEIDFSEVRYISKQDYDKFNARSKVNYGDILMPMIGTIGKPIIVNIPDEKINFTIKNVALVKFVENSKVNNIYIKNLFDSDYFENAISQNKRGGTQKFIALSDIRKLEIEIPPIELQNKFADFVRVIDKQKFEFEKSLKKLEELQAALMQEYFG